jgi:translocation and assembly module TamB
MRTMKWLRRIAIALGAVVLLTAAAGWWLLDSESGLRFVLARVQGFTGGALTVQQASGRVVGPLDLKGLRYRDGEGLDVNIATAHVAFRFWPLLRQRAHVLDLRADGVNIALPAPTNSDQDSGPISLAPPLNIVLDRAHIGQVKITQAGQPVFESNSLDLAGSWTGKGITLSKLALRAPDGRADLVGTLALGKDFRGDGKVNLAWKLGDTDYAGSVQARSDGTKAHILIDSTAPMLARVDMELVQKGDFAWTAKVDAPRFDPKPLIGESAITAFGLNAQGSGDRYSANLTGDVSLNTYQIQLKPLQARFSKDYAKLTLENLTIGSTQIKGNLIALGDLQLNAKPLSANLKLAWQDVLLPADLAGQDLASRGAINVHGSADQFHADGDVDIGPPGRLAKLALNLDGTQREIVLHTLSLKQPHGSMDVKGTLTLQPQLAWDVEASADHVDPSQLLADWGGSLNFDLLSSGKLEQQGPQATLDLKKLDGTLRQRSLRGSGTLSLTPNKVVAGKIQLASAGSTIQIDARGGASNDADLTVSMTSLGDWLPTADGSLDGRFNVRGLWPKLAVKGSLQGRTVSYAEQKIAHLKLDADIPDISKPGGTLDVEATGVLAGGMNFDTVSLRADGTADRHQLRLDARGHELSTDLALSGSLQGSAWSGTLSALDLDVHGLPRWRLQQPSQLNWTDGAASLSDLCLTAGEPSLCVAGKQDKSGNLDASYRLRDVPLALVMSATGQSDLPMRADGVLEGDGTIRRTAAGALSGQANITSPHGTIAYTDRPDEPLLVYNALVAKAQLAPGNQQATVQATLNDGGTLNGNISVTGAQQALGGQVTLHLKNLAFVSLFTDELAAVKGTLEGEFRLAGTVAEPSVNGQAVLDGFTTEIPAAGLKLKQGHVVVTTNDARTFHLDGKVHSGDGALTIGGSIGTGAAGLTEITVTGQKFLAADLPAAKVTVSPNLTIKRSPEGLNLNGKVTLDSADVDVSRLPGAGTTKASSDVVIVDDKQKQEAATNLPFTADLTVDLGEHTHLVGFGLDGRLSGSLDVRERPGRVTTGQGQIAIDGTYKAYGQNLKIEQGQLVFAGTPIDNPGLNIRAARTLTPNATVDEGQKVGLLVSGTASRPVLTVFSNPVMEQSDALSYLVTGKPLSQAKGGEGSAVGAAAQALGSAAGDLLAKNVGARIGVDDIGVSSSDALGGTSAFTVGKYLSPKLYISYGVGLFDPGQVITLRYIFTHRWNFEAQNATDFSRASFNYRYEK